MGFKFLRGVDHITTGAQHAIVLIFGILVGMGVVVGAISSDPAPLLTWDGQAVATWNQIPDSNRAPDYIERPYLLFVDMGGGRVDTILYVLNIEYIVGCDQFKPLIRGAWHGEGCQSFEVPLMLIKPMKVMVSGGIPINGCQIGRTTNERIVVLRTFESHIEGLVPSIAPYWRKLTIGGRFDNGDTNGS